VVAAGQAEVMHILRTNPVWLLPAVYVLLLVLSIVFYDPESKRPRRTGRRLAQLCIFLMILANIFIMALLVRGIFTASLRIGALDLVLAGAALWLVTLLTFGLAYWEVDGGGPEARRTKLVDFPDFLFPQQQADPSWHVTKPNWRPGLGDYMYVSLTSAVAFSPTDTMPLTPLAKVLMGAESLMCFVVFGVLVATAVNIAS